MAASEFFQHHRHIHASVPPVKCPQHGAKQIGAACARLGDALTSLFEQASMTRVREMPADAVARIMVLPHLTTRQFRAMDELLDQGLAMATATSWCVKQLIEGLSSPGRQSPDTSASPAGSILKST